MDKLKRGERERESAHNVCLSFSDFFATCVYAFWWLLQPPDCFELKSIIIIWPIWYIIHFECYAANAYDAKHISCKIHTHTQTKNTLKFNMIMLSNEWFFWEMDYFRAEYSSLSKHFLKSAKFLLLFTWQIYVGFFVITKYLLQLYSIPAIAKINTYPNDMLISCIAFSWRNVAFKCFSFQCNIWLNL